jgi:hypothetical protein
MAVGPRRWRNEGLTIVTEQTTTECEERYNNDKSSASVSAEIVQIVEDREVSWARSPTRLSLPCHQERSRWLGAQSARNTPGSFHARNLRAMPTSYVDIAARCSQGYRR